MNKILLNQISKLLVEAEDLLVKAGKRLLKVEVRDDFEDRFWDLLSKNKTKLDEESMLEFERDFEMKGTRWKVQGEQFLRIDKALRSIAPRKEFLEHVVERSNIKLPTHSAYIQAGKPYTAKIYLKKIIGKSNEITFVDNYFNPSILEIIEELLDDNQDLKIKILRAKPKNSRDRAIVKSLTNDVKVFNSQFSNAITEVKVSNSLPLHEKLLF